MSKKKTFISQHINATANDLSGNQGIGRYILLPGSDGRAREIAQHFDHIQINQHPRGHHLYLGSLKYKNQIIDVATLSSGMGCPSMEIILHELYHLGGKRFLRVGTAGSLQPNLVKINQLINVQAAVRDEDTTTHYVPANFPAIATPEIISTILLAAKKLGLADEVHTGTVHCKSSLYAREFGAGPSAEKNRHYIKFLSDCGILASEMETSALFIQSQLYNHELMQQGKGPRFRVMCGAILGIVANPMIKSPLATEKATVTKNEITLALETIKLLADLEK